MRLLTPTLFLAAFAGTTTTQTQPGLIGLTRNMPLVLEIDTTTCNAQRCLPALPSASTLAPYAGGTAYDSTRGATWVTNGNAIALVAQGTCATLCPAQPVPTTSPNAVATGLAYNEITKTLFVSDSLNNILTVAVGGCSLSVTSACQTWPVNTANPTIGGVATDDLRGLVFYVASMWTAAAPSSTVFVANQTSPCQYFCKLQVPSCTGLALGPITGLAHDCCKRILWATDGIYWVSFSYNLTTCTANLIGCCKLPFTGEPLIGLCSLPSLATSTDQSTTGKSCTGAPCPSCPAMEQTTTGQPTIGNPAFSLNLINAPANQNAVFVLNFGPCGPGVPFGCGQIFVPVPGWIALGPIATGGVGCSGGASIPLAIPPNPIFCGLVFSSQYAVICLAGPAFGTGLSNCLSFALSGI